MTIFHYENLTQDKPIFVSIVCHLDELKVSWDDNACKLIPKKCH